MKFRWEGDDLTTDNKATHVRYNYSSALKINKMLALKMGWLKERSSGNYELGPNLRQEFFTDTVPNLETMTHDLKNERDEPKFWLIDEDLFHVSVTCDWRVSKCGGFYITLIVHLFRCGRRFSGWKSGHRSIARGQLSTKRGWKSLFSTAPLRKELLDIIETQVSETRGELTEFGDGNTILTLHFKRA